MQIYLKNMVCHRCIMMVQSVFEKAGIVPLHISLGEVTVAQPPDTATMKVLSKKLQEIGFELMDNEKSRLIEQIKTFIITSIQNIDDISPLKFSTRIAAHVHHDYSYVSKLFSEVESITIEQYIIQQKIEKVKELIAYNELSLSQIALQLGYSSVAHLSNQFKKTTGVTPSVFKNNWPHKRKSLDEVGGKV